MSAPTPPTNPAPLTLDAPWRQEYLESLGKREREAGVPTVSSGSFLLDDWRTPQLDEANHVIVRTHRGMILLNAFPYSGGHLLCALGEPAPRLLDYSPEQRRALWTLVDAATDIIEHALSPQGINIGINQGRAAGAGVPQHLHAHLVPRWGGDVNFMSVVGQVRVIPNALDAMAARYRAAWEHLRERWRPLLEA
ncbi:MAG: HIT domain-containing protein [Phycisphaeraceae bacterium]|nr:HIT domain-containing protein [Phycisphaeraceae bacterium]